MISDPSASSPKQSSGQAGQVQFEISAVVSMSDSGGSSGRLRQEFDTLPAGDILRAVLAMSPYDYEVLKTIFHKNRFRGNEKLDGHNMGNLFLVLSEKYAGDYLAPVRALEQAVEAIGHVYPVTLNKTDLAVELSNGDIVRTEEVIDRPDYDKSLRIQKAWLEPSGKIYEGAKKVIEEADCIIIGPGSLYTSIVAALLPDGVKQAINKSSAKLIYVLGNAYEINGETGPKKLSEFVKELQEYLPRKLDTVIFNNHQLNEYQKEKYREKGWESISFDGDAVSDYNLIQADFEKEEGGLDPEKLGRVLRRIILSLK